MSRAATTCVAAATTCASSDFPPTSCRTLGNCDFSRVPLPAAIIATATRPALGTVNEWAFAAGEVLATEGAGTADERFLDFFIRPNIQRAVSGIAMNAEWHHHIAKPRMAIPRFSE